LSLDVLNPDAARMTNEYEQSPAVEEVVVRLLVDKTGITINQAKELINLIGYNLASLIREARLLKSKK
jgi:hypothetical protein